MGEAKRRTEHEERRAMRGTCQTCDHFAALEEECREDSPRLAIRVNPQTGIQEHAGLWPTTKRDKWCGKYKPDANAALRPEVRPTHLSGNGGNA